MALRPFRLCDASDLYHRAHDGRRDRRRTIVRRRRSDPSPSCVDPRSAARDPAGCRRRGEIVTPRAAALARGPPVGDGKLGRVRGAAGRAIPVSSADIGLASGTSCTRESGDRARCLSPRRHAHSAHSRPGLEAERTSSSCSWISRGQASIAADASQASHSCRAARGCRPPAHLLPPPSQPLRSRPHAPESTRERHAASAR